MKFLYLLAFLVPLLLSNSAFAHSISGRISDESGEALLSASVYISGSTKGDLSDDKGFYKITNLTEGIYQLVVSYMGYNVIRTNIYLTGGKDTTMNFSLEPLALEEQEIVVEAKRSKEWGMDLESFKRQILGEHYYTNEIVIHNPEVLSFERTYSSGSKILTAKAEEPLKITHKQLGYNLTVDLTHFKYDGKVMRAQYTVYYEDLGNGNDSLANIYRKNRTKLFTGSLRHFMKCLYLNTLEENGFKVYSCYREPNGQIPIWASNIKISGDTLTAPIKSSNMKLIKFPDLLKITYTEGTWYHNTIESIIDYSGPGNVFLTKSGYFYDPSMKIMVMGAWSDDRLGYALPLDYEPGE